ncbi:MAG: hypothetical protein FJ095_18310 [Deltaproteobacteria bacterium]|nr:hypothetical protein [Deltaproteobacteria bacterium]
MAAPHGERQLRRACHALAALAVAACATDQATLRSGDNTPHEHRHESPANSPALGPMRLLDATSSASIEIDPLLSTNPIRAPGDQKFPSVAVGKGDYFIAWEDAREGGNAIYGARISATGEVMDKGGLRLTAGPAAGPRVAYDGSQFVVGWSAGFAVELVKISAGLAPHVSTPLVVASGQEIQLDALAAGNGSAMATTLVPQVGKAGQADVALSFHHIENDSVTQVEPPGGIQITIRQDVAGKRTGIAACGDSYLIVLPPAPTGACVQSFTYPQIGATKALQPWDLECIGGSEGCRAIDIACRKQKDFMLAFVDDSVNVRFFSSTEDEFPFSVPGSGLRVAVSKSEYVAAWVSDDGVETATISKEIKPIPLGKEVKGIAPALAPGVNPKEAALVAFHLSDVEPAHDDVYVQPTAGNDSDQVPKLVSSVQNSQRAPQLVWTTSGPRVGWLDQADGTQEVRMRSLSNAAEPIGKAVSIEPKFSVPIEPGQPIDPGQPEGHGATFGLVLAGEGDTWIAAWAASPKPLQSPVLVLASGHGDNTTKVHVKGEASNSPPIRSPALAAHSGKAIVAYIEGQELGSAPNKTFIGSNLLVAQLSLADPTLPFERTITVTGSNPQTPTLALRADGSGVVVWEQAQVLYRMRLPAGDWTDPEEPSVVLASDMPQAKPALALREDKAEGLLVWREASNAGSHIRAKVVGADGAPLDTSTPGTLVSGPIAATAPRVAVHDGKYLVVWEGSFAGGNLQIWGAAVRFDGSLADEAPVRLSTAALPPDVMPVDDSQLNPPPEPTPPPSSAPSLVRSPTGELFLAYEQEITRFGVPRVVARKLPAELAVGDSCGAPSECATRYCVDGACCESACDGPCQRCKPLESETPASRGGSGGQAGEGAMPADAPGVCRPVTEGLDDACPGECGEPTEAERAAEPSRGYCGKPLNATCDDADECASHACFMLPGDVPTNGKGRCCTTDCAGPCDTCVDPASPGVCIRRECGGYACRADDLTGDKRCLDACVDTSECAAGFQCVAGRCVTPPQISAQDPSCALSVGRDAPRSRRLLGLGLAAALLARRLRRSRRPLS